MLIDLSQLDTDGVKVEEEFRGADLIVEARRTGESPVIPSSGMLRVWFRPDAGLARATGSVEIKAEATCDRCLKSLELVMKGEFDQRYAWSPLSEHVPARVVNDETSVLEQDLDIAEIDGPVFDTKELAREQTELLTPIHVLCTEACAGLCPECGADLNAAKCSCVVEVTDPRWDALKDLKLE
jgi:uncharacterized protein